MLSFFEVALCKKIITNFFDKLQENQCFDVGEIHA